MTTEFVTHAYYVCAYYVYLQLIAGASAYGAGVYPLLASAAFAAGFIGNFVTIPVLKSILGEDIKRA